jgi:antitoxin component YwqK of YwqJK toxin-antitoxin module
MRINIDDTDLDDAGSYLHDGELFTGELVETDREGNVLALTPVVKGRVHGIERTWHRDGALETETSVVNGVAVGASRQWHPNGQLAEEREFTDRGNLVAVRRWSEGGTALPS